MKKTDRRAFRKDLVRTRDVFHRGSEAFRSSRPSPIRVAGALLTDEVRGGGKGTERTRLLTEEGEVLFDSLRPKGPPLSVRPFGPEDTCSKTGAKVLVSECPCVLCQERREEAFKRAQRGKANEASVTPLGSPVHGGGGLPSCKKGKGCEVCGGRGFTKEEDEEGEEVLVTCPNALRAGDVLALLRSSEVPPKVREGIYSTLFATARQSASRALLAHNERTNKGEATTDLASYIRGEQTPIVRFTRRACNEVAGGESRVWDVGEQGEDLACEAVSRFLDLFAYLHKDLPSWFTEEVSEVGGKVRSQVKKERERREHTLRLSWRGCLANLVRGAHRDDLPPSAILLRNLRNLALRLSRYEAKREANEAEGKEAPHPPNLSTSYEVCEAPLLRSLLPQPEASFLHKEEREEVRRTAEAIASPLAESFDLPVWRVVNALVTVTEGGGEVKVAEVLQRSRRQARTFLRDARDLCVVAIDEEGGLHLGTLPLVGNQRGGKAKAKRAA